MRGVNLELKEKRKLINDVLNEFKNNSVPTITNCSGTKKLIENGITPGLAVILFFGFF